MSAWRRVALEMIPQCRKLIEQSENVSMLWIELHLAFERAYEEPKDAALIASIYRYASWCLKDSHNVNVQTAVVVAFYEHLPVGSQAVREEMPQWLSQEDFEGLRGPFHYFLSDKEFAAFEREFHKHRAARRRE